MAKCATCDDEFEQRHQSQRYCRLECRPSYNSHLPKTPKEPYDLICRVCSVEFKSTNKTRRYCSLKCEQAYLEERRIPEFDGLSECPLLIQCNRASGIDCSTREDWRKCDLLKSCVLEKRNRKRA